MQVPINDWPLGLCFEIATLDRLSVEQALKARVAFERASDDLDSYSAAVFSLDGVHFALQLYDHAPTENYTLIVMDAHADQQAQLIAFLAWAGLPDSSVAWRRPDERL